MRHQAKSRIPQKYYLRYQRKLRCLYLRRRLDRGHLRHAGRHQGRDDIIPGKVVGDIKQAPA